MGQLLLLLLNLLLHLLYNLAVCIATLVPRLLRRQLLILDLLLLQWDTYKIYIRFQASYLAFVHFITSMNLVD